MQFGIGKFGVHFIFCVLNDVIGCDMKIKRILICRFLHLTAKQNVALCRVTVPNSNNLLIADDRNIQKCNKSIFFCCNLSREYACWAGSFSDHNKV